jgi:hypothetical protein
MWTGKTEMRVLHGKRSRKKVVRKGNQSMYSEINEKMHKAYQGIMRLQKIDSMLERLEEDRRLLSRKESELKEVLDKEQYDVTKLEGKSLASVFYSILGSLEEHIKEERKEALAAKLKYDQTIKDMEDVKSEIAGLSAESEDYVNCQNDYDRLYDQKKQSMIRDAGETGQKVMDLSEKLSFSEANLAEIQEAISVGNGALEYLKNAHDCLGSAAGWGTWDIFGGGIISDLAKHSYIDDAKIHIEQTQRLLRRFKTELTDIHIDSDIKIETDGFARFADFFFDGLIADWFMQTKIQNSSESVYHVKCQVQDIMDKLTAMEAEEKNKLDTYQAAIDTIVIGG